MNETQLTDAELARLEELAELYLSGNALPFAESDYRESACNAVPLLVAEVRALRRHNQILRGGHKAVRGGLEAENAALRDRVEALEWLVECEQTYRLCFLNVRYRHNLEPEKYEDVGDSAFHEMVDILIAASEAIK